MEIIRTEIDGLLIVKPTVHADKRGYFFETFNFEEFKKEGIIFTPVQDNESLSSKGVIRGLHYQLKPYDQAKLIRVVGGKIFDVALDIRRNSPTFGKWFGIEIDSESKIQLLIPRGFAHGFSVLSNTAIIQYKIDNTYNKLADRGISINDPNLNIDWKLDGTVQVISEKDMNNPALKDAEINF
jgi:dTDP-4-dehydrorhamnose 3,5-epimerase